MRVPDARRALAAAALAVSVAGCGGVQGREADRSAGLVCTEGAKWSDAELASLRPEALKSVESILGSTDQQRCWMAGVKALGYLKGAEPVADLEAFIETGRSELARPESRLLIQEVFFSIGKHAAMDQSAPGARQAMKYLEESTDPAAWEKRGIHWDLDAVTRRELIRDLAGSAVVALTELTVHEHDADWAIEAREHLTQMALDSSDRHAFSLKYLTPEDATADLEDLINLHVLPAGRVLFATHRMTTLLTDEDADVKNLTLRVQELARNTLDQEQRWVRMSHGVDDQQVRLDFANRIADQRLSGLYGQLDGLDRLLDDAADQAAIDVIEDVMFPGTPKRASAGNDKNAQPAEVARGPVEGGVEGVIALPPERQVDQVLAAIDQLRREHKDAIARLKLADNIQVVEQAHLDLRKALHSTEAAAGADAVMRARSDLQTGVRVLVATVIAQFPGARPGDAERRHDLLRPLLLQNERVGDYFRSRQRVRDVDPESGRELAPLEEGGGTPKPGDAPPPPAADGGEDGAPPEPAHEGAAPAEDAPPTDDSPDGDSPGE